MGGVMGNVSDVLEDLEGEAGVVDRELAVPGRPVQTAQRIMLFRVQGAQFLCAR